MGVGEVVKQSRARGHEPHWGKPSTRLLTVTYHIRKSLSGNPAGMRGQQRCGVLCPLQAPGTRCSRLVRPVVVALRFEKGAVLSSGLSCCDNQPWYQLARTQDREPALGRVHRERCARRVLFLPGDRPQPAPHPLLLRQGLPMGA